MQFTGTNLALVASGLEHAISDIQTQIGSCPDVIEYEEDLEILEEQKATFQRLLDRIYRRHPELKPKEES